MDQCRLPPEMVIGPLPLQLRQYSSGDHAHTLMRLLNCQKKARYRKGSAVNRKFTRTASALCGGLRLFGSPARRLLTEPLRCGKPQITTRKLPPVNLMQLSSANIHASSSAINIVESVCDIVENIYCTFAWNLWCMFAGCKTIGSHIAVNPAKFELIAQMRFGLTDEGQHL